MSSAARRFNPVLFVRRAYVDWKALPESRRQVYVFLVKAVLTVAAFYLLLTHRIAVDEVVQADGRTQVVKIAIWRAMVDNIATIQLAVFVPFILAATLIKFVGIFSSMLRWHILLIGRGIRFNFWHIVGSFLIGRFFGTFLPSTVGLDSYKLYDAARFSGNVVEPAAATALEKVMGLTGLFLTFLIALPFGYAVLFDVLGDVAVPTILASVGIAVTVVAIMFSILFRPETVDLMLRLTPGWVRRRVENFLRQVSQSAARYRGQPGRLLVVSLLSVVVHFTTAAMYFFTALAIGVVTAEFWQVTLASSIQIFATVLSPFTIAGEGIREIAQTVLLHQRIGGAEATLSAALGFWAAEAMTLVGCLFLWGRPKDYRPRRIDLAPEVTQTDGQQDGEDLEAEAQTRDASVAGAGS